MIQNSAIIMLRCLVNNFKKNYENFWKDNNWNNRKFKILNLVTNHTIFTLTDKRIIKGADGPNIKKILNEAYPDDIGG